MTRPEVGAMSPAMDMSKVVLPQPEGPTKETNSLGSTWQEMFPIAKVVSPPSWRYVLERLWTSRIGTRTNPGALEYRINGIMGIANLATSIIPTFQSSNRTSRSRLRRHVADDLLGFDRPRNKLVLLRQINGPLEIFLRYIFFEERQPYFSGEIGTQAGPFNHRVSASLRIGVNGVNAAIDGAHKSLSRLSIFLDPFCRGKPTGD